MIWEGLAATRPSCRFHSPTLAGRHGTFGTRSKKLPCPGIRQPGLLYSCLNRPNERGAWLLHWTSK